MAEFLENFYEDHDSADEDSGIEVEQYFKELFMDGDFGVQQLQGFDGRRQVRCDVIPCVQQLICWTSV